MILTCMGFALEFFGVGSLVPVIGPLVACNMSVVLLGAYFLLRAGTVLKGFNQPRRTTQQPEAEVTACLTQHEMNQEYKKCLWNL